LPNDGVEGFIVAGEILEGQAFDIPEIFLAASSMSWTRNQPFLGDMDGLLEDVFLEGGVEGVRRSQVHFHPEQITQFAFQPHEFE